MPKPGAIKMYDDAVRGPRLPGMWTADYCVALEHSKETSRDMGKASNHA